MTMSWVPSSFGPGAASPLVMHTRVIRGSVKTMPKKERLPSPGEAGTKADLRGEDVHRSERWWPLRGREIEAAFVMHHDLKDALLAGQPDARLFHGCMLHRVDQQFPHRTKQQDGAMRGMARIEKVSAAHCACRAPSSISSSTMRVLHDESPIRSGPSQRQRPLVIESDEVHYTIPPAVGLSHCHRSVEWIWQPSWSVCRPVRPFKRPSAVGM